jgi:hypothetical protein
MRPLRCGRLPAKSAHFFLERPQGLGQQDHDVIDAWGCGRITDRDN